MIRRILLGLVGSPYTPEAIRTAADLAHRSGAEVAGVTVVDVERPAAAGESSGLALPPRWPYHGAPGEGRAAPKLRGRPR